MRISLVESQWENATSSSCAALGARLARSALRSWDERVVSSGERRSRDDRNDEAEPKPSRTTGFPTRGSPPARRGLRVHVRTSTGWKRVVQEADARDAIWRNEPKAQI